VAEINSIFSLPLVCVESRACPAPHSVW